MKTAIRHANNQDSKFYIAAIHDDQDFCDCCGKRNLKKVVLVVNANGAEMNVGTECAAKLCGITTHQAKEDMQAVEPGKRQRARIATAWYHLVVEATRKTADTDPEVMAIRDKHSSFQVPSLRLLASYVAQHLATA